MNVLLPGLSQMSLPDPEALFGFPRQFSLLWIGQSPNLVYGIVISDGNTWCQYKAEIPPGGIEGKDLMQFVLLAPLPPLVLVCHD